MLDSKVKFELLSLELLTDYVYMQNKNRIAVLSGRYPQTSFASGINHKAYCRKNNYCYINASWPTGAQNPYYNKLNYIKEYYNYFDYIFWIDDDAFFIDMDFSIEDLIEDDKFFVACKSPSNKTLFTFLSSGQFLLRCDEVGKSFIDKVSNTDLQAVKLWWDSDRYGFFSNGDQDAMVYHLITNDNFKKRYSLYEHNHFNSRIKDLKLDINSVVLLHFTGTLKIKKKHYREAQAILGYGPELVSNLELEALGVKKQSRSFLIRILLKAFVRIKSSFQIV